MQISLDLAGHEAEKDSKVDLLPDGDYLGKIVEVDCKETKGKTGWILVLYFQVLQGEFAGKIFCDNLNIANVNADAQRISLSRLKGILEKAGYANPNHLADTEHMIGLTLLATVVQEKYTTQSGNEATSNKVKKYAAAGATSPGGTVVSTPAAAPVAAPAKPAPLAAPVVPTSPAPLAAPVAPSAPVPPAVLTPAPSAPAAPSTPAPAAAPAAAGAFPWGAPK